MVDTLSLVVLMSRATPEEIAEEHAKYNRLTSAVTEALLTLPTKDLTSWNFRAMLFKQFDKIITDVLESGNGHPNVSKFYLCLLLYRIVARLMEPIEKKDCGVSDGAYQRRMMKRLVEVAGRTSATPLK
jgi:hypothetical protein